MTNKERQHLEYVVFDLEKTKVDILHLPIDKLGIVKDLLEDVIGFLRKEL